MCNYPPTPCFNPKLKVFRSGLFLVCLIVSLFFIKGAHLQNSITEENCYITKSTNVNGNALIYSLSPTKIKSCFNKIPYNAQVAQNTLEHAKKTLDAYSFENLAKNSAISGSSYSILVEARKKLNQFGTFSGDYLFHREITKIFNSFKDAHTIYSMPDPYVATILFPFTFTSKWIDEENQVVIVHPETTDIFYNTIIGNSTVNHAGRVVTKIDGVDAMMYLKHVADQSFISKDLSVRMNKVFKSRLYTTIELELPATDYMSITFDNGETINLPYMIIFNSEKNGISDFENQTKLKPSRNIHRNNFDHILAINPLELFLNSPIKKQDLRPHSNKRFEMASNLVYYSAEYSVFYYYFPEKSIAMFTITTFLPSPDDKDILPWTNFRKVFQMGVLHSKSHGVTNLILNVQENGGGYVCLAMSLLNYLIPSFSNKDYVDERREYKIRSIASDIFLPGFYLDYTTKKVLRSETALSSTPISKNFGGFKDYYSQPFSINCNYGSFWFEKSAPHYYSKIIVLTDGLCGSACSQFITKLQAYNKAKIVNIGGAFGSSTFETSSFCGGSVVNTAQIKSIPSLITNAQFTVNAHHLYMGYNPSLPREFVKHSGDLLLKTFDFENHTVLIDMISPIFEAIEPTNTESLNPTRNYMTIFIVLVSFVILGWLLCCVCCCMFIVATIRKRKVPSMTDYVEFKTTANIN